MGEKSVEERVQGLWHRAKKLPSLRDLNKELVAEWARDSKLSVESVEERNIGRFRSFPAVVLKAGNFIAAYPKVSATDDSRWLANKEQRDADAELWNKVEWFQPLWVSFGDAGKILAAIAHRNKIEAIQHFDYHTSTIYTLPFQAVCVTQLIPACRSLTEFAPVIREAYLAAYSGYAASSIAALIPVIEGALRKISCSPSDAPVRDVVDLVCDRACRVASRLYYSGMWVPDEYTTSDYLFAQDELVFVFDTFRKWLKNSFFRQTGEYDGATWLNRHLFAHGASTNWQEGANLRRLIVALATLGLIESWHDETYSVSLLFPEMNDESKLLWQQALLRGHMQAGIKQHEQSFYQKHGRLVPELPGDGGETLRAARLGEECIKELVRPLRDAGWQVKMSEPDEKGLWVKVEATCGEERLNVGLLFSCASDNELYRELAVDCSAILYLGPPYKQSSFAYGINVHVGPVAGWRPPAPQR
ncbi:MAG: hypothetical protein L0H10_12065 [Comamonas sp.]|uniref:hypothetical protein n=1 Tax=Comamonas sp. TaxID=34028 RepID=UPI002648BFA7|nr:hypothetical protein [Comamonas sp.]MDN5504533.1 hypothetical protein [Comamonas sp.]MDN5535642.1 hypothetical protein [Comamonas sp.]